MLPVKIMVMLEPAKLKIFLFFFFSQLPRFTSINLVLLQCTFSAIFCGRYFALKAIAHPQVAAHISSI